MSAFLMRHFMTRQVHAHHFMIVPITPLQPSTSDDGLFRVALRQYIRERLIGALQIFLYSDVILDLEENDRSSTHEGCG